MNRPLTPADCDLRDFAFMQIDVQRLLTSETWILGNADEKAAAITLWLACWHQVPAASIPNNDKMLAFLSQAGAKWPKVKAHALRGWVDGGDGRLYHPVVAEKALAAWIEKLSNAIAGSEGNAKRWKTEVDTSAQEVALRDAIELLKRIAPASPCLKKKLVATRNKSSPPDRPPIEKSSPPDRKGEGEGEGYIPPNPQPGEASADPPQASDVDEPPKPSMAGAVCVALKGIGMGRVNPGNMQLRALLEAGADIGMFVAAGEEAVRRGKDFGYTLAIVQRQLSDAKTIAENAVSKLQSAPSGGMIPGAI